MRQRDAIGIAVKNVMFYRKTTLIVVVGMIMSAVMIFCAVSYNLAATEVMRELENEQISMAYNRIIETDAKTIDRVLEVVSKSQNISDVQIYTDSLVDRLEASIAKSNGKQSSTLEGDSTPLVLDQTEMLVAGKAYYGINDLSFDFPYGEKIGETVADTNVYFVLRALVVPPSRSISDVERKEYESKSPEGQYLIGRLSENPGELMISSYMLEKYGIPSNEHSALIGETVSFRINSGEDIFLQTEDFTLVGIINADFFRILSRRESPQIILCVEKDTVDLPLAHISENYDEMLTTQKESSDTEIYNLIVYSDNFSDAVRAGQEIRQVGIEANMSWVGDMYAFIETQNQVFTKIVSLIGAMLVVTIVVFLLMTTRYYMDRRAEFIEMERTMGMRRRHITAIYAYELMMVGALTLATSIPLSIMLMQLIKMMLMDFVSDIFRLNASHFITASAYTAIYIAFLTIVLLVRERIQSTVALRRFRN